uniref:Z-ring associated protein G n=1 Tax=Candidatus Kentrum sp. LFY TaxID=2126342 RepID=A0A450W900_9GAMM|nr:MAG: hypothetical protein BECKLFY1418C_GA0070996_100369 [Candidatus Kentron sp. LFY]
MAEYSMTWALGVGGAMLVVGIGLGMLTAYFLLPGTRQAKKLQKELDDVIAEFSQYRGRVAEHFSMTSDLFQDLTTRYRGLYDHLASGARSLCRETSGGGRLDFADVGLLANRDSRVDAIPKPNAQEVDSGKPGTEKGESDTEAQTLDRSSSPRDRR